MSDYDAHRFDMREGFLMVPWYGVQDDEVSGWACATADKPASELDYSKGELVTANFLSRNLADHIARLHNEWLDKQG